MDKIEVTQADRLLVADMLDEVSNLLDHSGIGQVADLIRDGEYDEHDCVKIAARHRLATRTDATPVATDVAALVEAATALRTAVKFADPPKLFNGVLCHEARVPVEFIDELSAALAPFTKGQNDA